METWALFSGSDIFLAVLGILGFASVFTVLRTASRNVNKREMNIKNRRNG